MGRPKAGEGRAGGSLGAPASRRRSSLSPKPSLLLQGFPVSPQAIGVLPQDFGVTAQGVAASP
jgi:hypothetical protein